MSRRFEWAITLACRLLEPDGCEALLGDLEEAGASRAAMVRGSLGFLVRAQVQAWRSSRPWLVLGAIVLPLGLCLNLLGNELVGRQTVYVWMYAANWTSTYLHAGWLWTELTPMLGAMTASWLLLALASGAVGFLLARTAGRTAWLQGAVFISLLLAGQAMAGAVLHPGLMVTQPPLTGAAAYRGNAAAFATAFYRLVLPTTLHLLCLVTPAVYGLWRGMERRLLKTTVR